MIRRPPRSTLFPYTTLFRSIHPDQNPLVRIVTRFLPISRSYDEEKFFTVEKGKRTGTLLLLVLRSEEHTSELQSHVNLVCRLLLEKKNNRTSCARDLPRYCA